MKFGVSFTVPTIYTGHPNPRIVLTIGASWSCAGHPIPQEGADYHGDPSCITSSTEQGSCLSPQPTAAAPATWGGSPSQRTRDCINDYAQIFVFHSTHFIQSIAQENQLATTFISRLQKNSNLPRSTVRTQPE
ncbi:hypothetical protein AVEN_145640-1 [Araneus ventricosus]|uniref:Uncharacterized protein n=1 Tax=Araneus ventricosus TaxID=182803 RepID=A0A4Y2MNF2_ARAVE|nr:hypothetical protein AVEN_145640-1 [Araneus ventricosus]